jgi:hypothetical protein
VTPKSHSLAKKIHVAFTAPPPQSMCRNAHDALQKKSLLNPKRRRTKTNIDELPVICHRKDAHIDI